MYSVQKSTESFYFGVVHGLSTDCAQLSPLHWLYGLQDSYETQLVWMNMKIYRTMGFKGFVDEYSGEDSKPIFESFSTMIRQECQNALNQEFHQNGQSVGIDDFQRFLDID